MLAMRYCGMVQVHAEDARPSDGFLVGAKSAEIEDQIVFGAQVPATPAKAFLVDTIHPATEVSDGFFLSAYLRQDAMVQGEEKPRESLASSSPHFR